MYRELYDRKIGLDEILTIGWDIYIKHFKPILIITLIIYIPINIILYFFDGSLSTLKDFRNYINVIKILEAFFGILATMGIVVIVDKVTHTPEPLEGEEAEKISWGESLSKSLSRWGSCVWTDVLGGFIILGLTFLLIIPGIIWIVYYSFIAQVVVIKGLRGKEALNYSKSLVKGQWWRTFGIIFVLNLINIIIGAAMGFVSAFVPNIAGILTNTVIDIIGAYFTVATTVFFINIDYLESTEVIQRPNDTLELQ